MAERRQSCDDSYVLRLSDDDELCSVADAGGRNDLKEFILFYETCPSLWNPKDRNYLNKIKRNEDLGKLLQIYKNIKPNATKDDVKKKINSLRSNYRKELKKIETSKRSGAGGDEVYKPSSSTFHLLKFLTNIEAPMLKKDNVSSEVSREEDNSLIISSITNEAQPTKIRRTSGTLAKQNELLHRACSLLSQPSVSLQQEVDPLALVWSDKLKSLNPTQKLYAEKAINDILFEAQLNNLHRHSVQINKAFTHSSPATSTPYPYTPSPVSNVPESMVSDNCEIYTSLLTDPPVSYAQEDLTPSNCETYPPVLHIPELPIVHVKGSTSTHGKPSSTSKKTTNVQSGPASQIIFQRNPETRNSDEYTVGSLFARFKPI